MTTQKATTGAAAQTSGLAAIVLAAGKGTRMQSALPKVLHRIAGRPMLGHVAATLAELNPQQVLVVVPPGGEAIAAAAPGARAVVQTEAHGTGDAVDRARDALAGFDGDVLVVFADTPFLTADTMRALLAARRGPGKPALAVLGFEPAEPGAYGRLVRDGSGALAAIVEAKDANAAELTIRQCNSGMMVADCRTLFSLLSEVGSNNAKGERYLTDVVRIARARGLSAAAVMGDESELMGINSRAELAVAEGVVQDRLRRRAMDGGATLIDPATVYFSMDTRVGRDVLIEPGVIFGPGVVIGDEVTIRAYSHIEGAIIESGATVGPFARLRPGTKLEENSRVGNFVEVKNTTLGPEAKANHLTYLGDATIGAGANIGAGTITCNYDGYTKSHTDIGDGAFIGSNTALVAPVKVGKGAVVGAGSTITRDVPADALSLTRAEQKEFEGWAGRRRAERAAAKAKHKPTGSS